MLVCTHCLKFFSWLKGSWRQKDKVEEKPSLTKKSKALKSYFIISALTLNERNNRKSFIAIVKRKFDLYYVIMFMTSFFLHLIYRITIEMASIICLFVLVLAFLISHDGKYIISGSENQYIYMWKTHHDYAKFSSARRDRNDYWEAIKGILNCFIVYFIIL